MNIWVIKVTYQNNQVNISQAAFTNFNEAVKEIRHKINEDDLKQINDYIFYDLENNIEYELKSVFIQK